MSYIGCKVSILLSVYNQKDFIQKSLESVLLQDYPNLEIVIGDDFSTDFDVRSFVEKYNDPRIIYIKNEKNLGRTANYKSMLFNHSTGMLATVLNADDYFVNEAFIRQAVKIFSDHNNIGLVFSRINTVISSTGEVIRDRKFDTLKPIMSGNQLFLDQVNGIVLPHLTSVYDRQRAIDLNFYNFPILSDDWEGLLRIIQGSKVGFIDKVSGHLVRNQLNVTKSTDLDELFNAVQFIVSAYNRGLQLGQIPVQTLEPWKSKLYYNHFLKSYIKLSLWSPHLLHEFKRRLNEEFPDVRNRMKKDYRIWVFNVIKTQPWLLRKAFSIYTKKESVIVDFIKFADRKNGL